MLRENIQHISATPRDGMDVIIVATSSNEERLFWEKRLTATKDQLLKEKALVCIVVEDFPKGAGNGLGSLYAYQKAHEKLFVELKTDLYQRQREGASVALYHTCGRGQRLFPLTASEYGIKAAILLPKLLEVNGNEEPITLLEMVILQTALYARSRRGRLSVFWTDQLFIPSVSPDYTPRAHADLLVKMIPMPRQEEWESKELSKYGVVLFDQKQNPHLLEKVHYSAFQERLSKESLHIGGGLGISLGSFSLSAPLTKALLQEFQPELIQKSAKMDADPFFWMALTHESASYIELMKGLGYSQEEAKNHHLRMQYFCHHFERKQDKTPLFGIVDIGTGAFFWDFGSVKEYTHHLLKLTQNTVEGYLLRELFQLPQGEDSIVLASEIGSGKLDHSIVISSKIDKVNIENTVVVGSSIFQLQAKKGLFYNIYEDKSVVYPDNTLRADCYLSATSELVHIFSQPDLDPKSAWHARLPSNLYTFSELQEKVAHENQEACRSQFKKLSEKNHVTAL